MKIRTLASAVTVTDNHAARYRLVLRYQCPAPDIEGVRRAVMQIVTIEIGMRPVAILRRWQGSKEIAR